MPLHVLLMALSSGKECVLPVGSWVPGGEEEVEPTTTLLGSDIDKNTKTGILSLKPDTTL